MCIYVRTERKVSQGAVRHRKDRPAELVQEQHARKSKSKAAATHEADPFDFLNVKIESKAVTEEHMPSCFALNLESSYDRLCKVSAKFLDYFGKPFDYEPPKDNSAGKFDALVTWFEKKVEEVGFLFATVKHDSYDEDCGDIDFVVYNPTYKLEMKVTSFIVSPVETLPKKAAYLYARFIKFLSRQMCLSLDIEHTDNYYLDMAINYFGDPEENIDELEGEDKKMLQERRDLIASYKTGKYKKIYDEINRLEANGLEKDIDQFIAECKDKSVVYLFKVLKKGLPIVSKMNIHWFDFNPDKDGIEDSQDSYIEVFNQQMILYSFNDGIEDEVVRLLDSDYNCGLIPVGYNMHLTLHKSLKREDVAEFVDNRNLGNDFYEWYNEYYNAVKKFDPIKDEDDD